MSTKLWASLALATACLLAAATAPAQASLKAQLFLYLLQPSQHENRSKDYHNTAAMDVDERETCWGALDVLRECSAGMVYHDLQQHCCIPFRALEGMDCLCGEGSEQFMGAAIDTMMPNVIDGLAACGVDSPFARMYRKQESCAKRVPKVAMPAIDDEDFFLLPAHDGNDWMAPGITSGFEDGAIRMQPGADVIELPDEDISNAYYEMTDSMDIDRLWDLFMEGPREETDTPEQEGVSIDVELEGGLGSFSVSGSDSLEVALNDGVLSITDDSSNSLVYDGVSQVTLRVADDVDVDVTSGAPEEPQLVVAAEGSADAEVFNADFADVGGMKQLIGQWMGGLLGGDGQDRMDLGDSDVSPLVNGDGQSLVGGLSRFLAEILAKLETSYGGAPLDVEISYEMDDDESVPKGETEIDIEIDPELVPALTPQFLDERLRVLSDTLNRHPRQAPVRVSDVDFMEIGEEVLQQQAPTLSNCFNTGICSWLCQHRRMLQYALGVETVLLVALFAFYARISRQAAQQGLDADEESLRVPLIEHASDYAEAGAAKASPLWTLTTKVAFEKQ
ncbi:hypothetical protein COCSUDRAFT_47246 [Coccomyxa subellipsoidea C-169]|uniref:Bifunctional inhibitor/plant lipid transfer protein/seed storage helical domain-containing protein n=1 Tax=Coccomyxa subellipsoidea (strain C-169) TaxID=574566 RepID=I0Z144_COCSC|nr:hypothetical protein COCSUDRAFT_47246 [Coccomyxa subellipsoidea C-169]EIE24363.1 hypothetical protein COCSUDRAFT_47246 [Coccomyxa subellipsoidea C-169]|eukprot:XP_005648907.1 hypothetical protein COCSUDRAFT_47246 [Coccomyxa subellipsoidea C-169]